MDVEETQEMLDVGVKKSGRDAPSSVCCVPWRLAPMEFVKSLTKSGGWVSIHDVFFGEQAQNTSFHSMTSETRQKSNGLV